MVATSPVRHESPIQINPIEVQTYQPPWKALTEYALQPEIDPTEPHFQQIVSQVRHFTACEFGRQNCPVKSLMDLAIFRKILEKSF